MNELLTDPRSWVIVLLTVIWGIMTWLFKREVSRIDEALRDSVRRAEYDQLRQDLAREHKENTDRLGRIEDTTRRTHERIDDLYSDIIDKIK